MHRFLARLFRKDRPDGHLTVARDVHRDGSTEEAAFRDLCMQLAQSGEVARAKAVALQGIAAFPQSAILHTYLGNLLAQEGDNVGAVDRYRRALSIGPRAPSRITTSASSSESSDAWTKRLRATPMPLH